MPKWLEELLQALQIFAQIAPIITGVAGTFGASSAEAQDLAMSLTTDPTIPAGVQTKLQKYSKVHLALLAKMATATTSKAPPVTA